MIADLWYTVTHDPLSAVVLALAGLHLFRVLVACITLRPSLHLERLAENRRQLDRRLRYRGRGRHGAN